MPAKWRAVIRAERAHLLERMEAERVAHDKHVAEIRGDTRSTRDSLEIDRLSREVDRLREIESHYNELREYVVGDGGPIDRVYEILAEITYIRGVIGDPDRKSTGRPPAIPDRFLGVVQHWVNKEGRSINSVAKELNVSRGAVRAAVERANRKAWVRDGPAILSERERELKAVLKAVGK